METVGEVNVKEMVYEWVIKDFLSLSVEDYASPLFSFANESWCLIIYPNGHKDYESQGYISLGLYRKSTGSPITIEFDLAVKTLDENLISKQNELNTFEELEGYCHPKFISRSIILEEKSNILPSNALTLICWLRYPEFTQFKNDATLGQDFKKILVDGKNHDLILKVGDKKLRAHQDILRARSPVFYSMLIHDMIEMKSGVVDIPDCDPQAMEHFLMYVYSGKVETLDQTNMFELYYIADKYEMHSLKENCRNSIKKSLSHTNICKVIQLSMNHSDESLLEYATEYFMDNTVDIMLTVEWPSFLKDNMTLGNELMIKSFRKVNKKLKIQQ